MKNPRTDFLKYLAEGDTVKEAAKKVNMGHKTVEGHLFQLRREKNARNMVHLLTIAIKEGLI